MPHPSTASYTSLAFNNQMVEPLLPIPTRFAVKYLIESMKWLRALEATGASDEEFVVSEARVEQTRTIVIGEVATSPKSTQ